MRKQYNVLRMPLFAQAQIAQLTHLMASLIASFVLR